MVPCVARGLVVVRQGAGPLLEHVVILSVSKEAWVGSGLEWSGWVEVHRGWGWSFGVGRPDVRGPEGTGLEGSPRDGRLEPSGRGEVFVVVLVKDSGLGDSGL